MTEHKSTAIEIADDLLRKLNNKVRSELVSHVDEYFQKTDFQKILAFQNNPESNSPDEFHQDSENIQIVDTLETHPHQIADDQVTENSIENLGEENQKSSTEHELQQETTSQGNNLQDPLIDNINPTNIVDEHLAFQEEESQPPNVSVNFLMEMALTVTFEVGRTRMDIKDLISLGQGSIVELHRFVGEDLDIFVNGKLVARGELVVCKENFGAKISDIISPKDRVKQMGGLAQF
jgi:flagellar motor switch protein FliN/FliY